jgi:hypothetical protein
MQKLGRATPALGLLGALFVMAACHGKTRSVEPAQKPDSNYGLSKEQSARVLVKFGATTVTLGQFVERLSGQSPYLTARYDSPERRREFLDEVVRFELMATEAEKRGYDRRGDVERVRKQAMVEQMMHDLFEKQGVKLSDISDAEIQKYYAEHADELEKRTLAEARGVIQNRLWRAKREAAIAAFVAELRSKAGVQENAELLRKVRVNTDPPALGSNPASANELKTAYRR